MAWRYGLESARLLVSGQPSALLETPVPAAGLASLSAKGLREHACMRVGEAEAPRCPACRVDEDGRRTGEMEAGRRPRCTRSVNSCLFWPVVSKLLLLQSSVELGGFRTRVTAASCWLLAMPAALAGSSRTQSSAPSPSAVQKALCNLVLPRTRFT